MLLAGAALSQAINDPPRLILALIGEQGNGTIFVFIENRVEGGAFDVGNRSFLLDQHRLQLVADLDGHQLAQPPEIAAKPAHMCTDELGFRMALEHAPLLLHECFPIRITLRRTRTRRSSCNRSTSC